MFLGTFRIAKSNRKRGFVLVMMAVSAVALVAVMGLALDIGRMYVIKNEAQVFADAGALMAAKRLDGSPGGLLTASQLIAINPNRYDFGNREFTPANMVIEYAGTLNGPWFAPDAAFRSAPDIQFVRVQAVPSTALYFLPIVMSQKSAALPAVAIAARNSVRLVQ